MNTPAASHRTAFRAPVSGVARAATALAVAGFVTVAWLSAGTQSQQAVTLSSAALSRTYVTLPPVNIVAQREGKLAPVAVRSTGRSASAL